MKKTETDLIKIKEGLIDEINSGKHASYQSLSPRLQSLLGNVEYSPNSRYESQRFDYMKSKVSFENKKVIDIGCNMGYFTLSSLDAGAAHVTAYEGAKNHAEFVSNASNLLGVSSKVSVHNQYFNFNESVCHYDIAILLNVLHHVGDDYGDPALTIDGARELIIEQLNSMVRFADKVCFQLGFNWRGNRNYGLFENGTKEELIKFIRKGIEHIWKIDCIGIATRDNSDRVGYDDLNHENINRDDRLGEFLNRPLFILSKL